MDPVVICLILVCALQVIVQSSNPTFDGQVATVLKWIDSRRGYALVCRGHHISKLPEMLDLADKDLSRTGTRQHIPHGEGVLVSFIFALPAGGSAATRGG